MYLTLSANDRPSLTSSPRGALVGGVHLGSDRATERVRERLGVHHYTVDSVSTGCRIFERIDATFILVITAWILNSLTFDSWIEFTFRAEVCDSRARLKECRPRQSYWNSRSATQCGNKTAVH